MIGCYHLPRGRHVTRTSIKCKMLPPPSRSRVEYRGELSEGGKSLPTNDSESRGMFDPHFCFRGSETRFSFLDCGASLLTLPEGRRLWLLSSGNAPEYGSDDVVRTLDEKYNLCTRIGLLVLYLDS